MLDICDNHIMNKELFAQTVRDSRNERGLTQQELAQLVGLSRYTIQDWEAGRRTPNLDMLPKIARALDISVNRLMGETDNPDAMSETSQGREGKRRSQALEDLERMLGDLSHQNPDMGLLLRSTVENWDDLNEHDIKFISDSIAIALGRVSDELKSRIRRESKDGRL